jgi:hypothetical protein
VALRRVLIAAAWLAACLGGCVEELPEPAECPAPAQVPEGDCSTIEPPLTGCLPPEEHACLAGPRSSCACGADECPSTPDACYPPGDCPPEVTAAAPGARCLTIDEEHVGDFGVLPPGDRCTCGCTRCMSVCDGKGPTFGATIVGDGSLDREDVIMPLVRLDDLLPASGRLGFYVRLRGTAGTILYVYRGDPFDPGEIVELGTGVLSAVPGRGFTSQVVYQELVGAGGVPAPLTWDTPEEKPSLMILLPNVNTSGPLLVEIDCIVPFTTD